MRRRVASRTWSRRATPAPSTWCCARCSIAATARWWRSSRTRQRCRRVATPQRPRAHAACRVPKTLTWHSSIFGAGDAAAGAGAAGRAQRRGGAVPGVAAYSAAGTQPGWATCPKAVLCRAGQLQPHRRVLVRGAQGGGICAGMRVRLPHPRRRRLLLPAVPAAWRAAARHRRPGPQPAGAGCAGPRGARRHVRQVRGAGTFSSDKLRPFHMHRFAHALPPADVRVCVWGGSRRRLR